MIEVSTQQSRATTVQQRTQKDRGTLMATNKAASIKLIEATLAKIERELEDAQEPRKQTMRKLIARMYPTLRTLGQHTLH